MDLSSPTARTRYADLVRAAGGAVVGLDFDGVLAPIVDDPDRAFIHPRAGEVLVGLAARVRAVAVITGRPAAQAVELGALDHVADGVEAAGGRLAVFGQYGHERWSSGHRRVDGPPPPEGLAAFEAALPDLLHRADAAGAHVERKGLALAVHTRRLPDAAAAYDRLLPALTDAARTHDLHVEPGRSVVEVRAGGMHKGLAVRTLVEETGATAMLYAGDDLGDLAAFDAVDELRSTGLAGLLVASASGEEEALVARADVVVPGPDGVLDLLKRLTADLGPTGG